MNAARKTTLAIVLLILAATPTRADDSLLKLPKEVKGDVGDFIRVESVTSCEMVQWYAIDAGLKIFPVELLKNSRTAVVTAAREGRYRLLAYTALSNKPSEPCVCVVIIGNAPPQPDPPGPGPQPPADDFVKALQAAYDSDTDPGKATKIVQLANLYRRFGDPQALVNLATWQDVFSAMQTQAAALSLQGKLLPVQQVIRDTHKDILARIPTTPVDEASRKLLADTFLAIARALDKVKQ